MPTIWPRGLRGRKYSYCESTTAVHFSDLYRYVEPLCASKDRKNILAVAISRYGYFFRADPWVQRNGIFEEGVNR